MEWLARHGRRTDKNTLVIVHLGGNDALYCLRLLGPFALLLLGLDCVLLLAGRLGMRPRLTTLPHWSFFGFVARRIAASLEGLLAQLAGHGYTRVLVSSMPICSAMPLPRKVLGLVTCAWAWRGGAQLVTDLIDDAVALLDAQLRAALAASGARHQLRLVYFDEVAALVDVARGVYGEGQAHRAQVGDAMWRDAHHPRAWVHEELAAAAARQLDHEE